MYLLRHLRNIKTSKLSIFSQLMEEKGEPESYIKESLYLKSRDNARTPFPWNGDITDGYGFQLQNLGFHILVIIK